MAARGSDDAVEAASGLEDGETSAAGRAGF